MFTASRLRYLGDLSYTCLDDTVIEDPSYIWSGGLVDNEPQLSMDMFGAISMMPLYQQPPQSLVEDDHARDRSRLPGDLSKSLQHIATRRASYQRRPARRETKIRMRNGKASTTFITAAPSHTSSEKVDEVRSSYPSPLSLLGSPVEQTVQCLPDAGFVPVSTSVMSDLASPEANATPLVSRQVLTHSLLQSPVLIFRSLLEYTLPAYTNAMSMPISSMASYEYASTITAHETINHRPKESWNSGMTPSLDAAFFYRHKSPQMGLSPVRFSQNHGVSMRVTTPRPKPQCWEHGCNGRQFSTFSNLLRHQREKSGQCNKPACPKCGAEFTRTTARNGHMAHEKCKQKR